MSRLKVGDTVMLTSPGGVVSGGGWRGEPGCTAQVAFVDGPLGEQRCRGLPVLLVRKKDSDNRFDWWMPGRLTRQQYGVLEENDVCQWVPEGAFVVIGRADE